MSHAAALLKQARLSRDNSYSPYSGHKVGAAILTSDGKVHGGCNVENSSYGGTVCAERAAIFSAVSQGGRIRIVEVAVVTDSTPPWPPCGLCRQIISEFIEPDAMIHAGNLKGDTVSWKFSELMPEAFTPSHLGK